MSFEPNDNRNMIHLGNYEEFFILYMDNELSPEQVKMVDEFLATNPDLKAEFEILVSTKLPMEEFSFDKKDLLAENMKLSLVDEELLLYIDNELAADRKKTIELELASNKDYQLQHQVLLQTKLDASEKIAYPNKKELYRTTEKVIVFKPWMRVAAAVIVIATAGILYFTNNNSAPSVETTVANNNQPKQQIKDSSVQQLPSIDIIPDQNLASSNSTIKMGQPSIKTGRNEDKTPDQPKEENLIAVVDVKQNTEDLTLRPKITDVKINDEGTETFTGNGSSDFLNTNNVTSIPSERKIDGTPDNPDEPIANNDRKGSIKGFLRKATRMIEKRTGIDPTNDDGALLIGAVAINLK